MDDNLGGRQGNFREWQDYVFWTLQIYLLNQRMSHGLFLKGNSVLNFHLLVSLSYYLLNELSTTGVVNAWCLLCSNLFTMHWRLGAQYALLLGRRSKFRSVQITSSKNTWLLVDGWRRNENAGILDLICLTFHRYNIFLLSFSFVS